MKNLYLNAEGRPELGGSPINLGDIIELELVRGARLIGQIELVDGKFQISPFDSGLGRILVGHPYRARIFARRPTFLPPFGEDRYRYPDEMDLPVDSALDSFLSHVDGHFFLDDHLLMEDDLIELCLEPGTREIGQIELVDGKQVITLFESGGRLETLGKAQIHTRFLARHPKNHQTPPSPFRPSLPMTAQRPVEFSTLLMYED